jgi:hypothetical protein
MDDNTLTLFRFVFGVLMFGFLMVAAFLIYLIHICFRLLILSDEALANPLEVETNPTANVPVEAATKPANPYPVRDLGVNTSRLVTAPRRAPHPNVPAEAATTPANPPVRSAGMNTSQSVAAPRSTPLNTLAPNLPVTGVTRASALGHPHLSPSLPCHRFYHITQNFPLQEPRLREKPISRLP